MKKKISFTIIFLLIVCLLASCNIAPDKTQNNSTSNTVQTQKSSQTTSLPTAPPDYVTALTFDGDFVKAKNFVEKNDLSEFGEKDKANIGNMIDSFVKDGYLTRVGSKISEKETFLFLGPQYGEVTPHISYRIYVGEASYLITVWNEKKEVIPENWQVIEYSGENLGEAKNLYMNKDESYLRFQIDETHHVTVQATEKSRENLLAFAESLTFEKVALEKAE